MLVSGDLASITSVGQLTVVPTPDRTLLIKPPLELVIAEVRFVPSMAMITDEQALAVQKFVQASGFVMPQLQPTQEASVEVAVAAGQPTTTTHQVSRGWQLTASDPRTHAIVMPGALVIQTAGRCVAGMTTRTGATLSNFDVVEHIEPLPRERHTYCVTDDVDNPSLRAALSFFDDSLIAPMQPYLLFLNYCQNSRPARGSGTDPSVFAGRSTELEGLLDHIIATGSGRLTVLTGSPGTGKSALLRTVASALAPVLSNAGMPTRMHLAVHAVLDTGLPTHTIAGAALGSVVGTLVGSFTGSASILAGKLPESGQCIEPVLETSAHKFDDVVEVVRDLQHSLGIDLKDVLAAASIKPRTYHSWAQPSAPRPRLASQGRLWALAQLVDDLPELLDVPLRQWVLADPDRLAALRAGRFDELLEQATRERIQKDPAGTVAGPFHGVGEDGSLSPPTTNRELVIDEQAITEPAPPPSRGSPGLAPT